LQRTALNNVGSDDYAGIFAGRISSSAGQPPSCSGPNGATYYCWVYGYLTPTT
jgi:hypothetical protein